ncbi:hypothetical protein [Streptomyces sp. AK010]|nr:hypothetical protein [Streptomyces sp. AK010]MBB6421583.1 hypothetical protein [Streptomyces sp. AK010]
MTDSRTTPIRSLLRTLAQATTVPDSGRPAIFADAIFRALSLAWSAK